MEAVKEDVEVVVREITKPNEVKDVELILNTSQSGHVSYITDLINGVLDGVLICSPNPIQIKITLDGYEELVLLEMINYSGEKYLPLEVNAISCEGIDFANTQEKWILNDRIRVDIKGPLNSTISIKLRYR